MHIILEMHYVLRRPSLNVFLSSNMRSVLVLEGLAVVLVIILVFEVLVLVLMSWYKGFQLRLTSQ